MKRVLAIIIGIIMILCFSACEKDEALPLEAEHDLNKIVSSIKLQDGFAPQIGIVLGSGLHGIADEVEVVQTIPYEDIPGFPYSTVEGHEGQYILGYLEEMPVILMDGRIHYYEGYSMEEVVTPVRIMAKLGVETVILTNASGSFREDFAPGNLVCINDHISSYIPNPLIGQNDESLGERFVGMADAYDPSLRTIAHQAAKELDIELLDGVYLQVTGPSFETAAESKAFAALGADIVGMSTVCETIALRHMGVRVLGISLVTNYCPNIESSSVSHDVVQEEANKYGEKAVRLIRQILKQMSQ